MIPLLNAQWKFGYAQISRGDGPEKKLIFSQNFIHYIHIPALLKKAQELDALGFVLNAKYISIGRDEEYVDGVIKAVTYSIGAVVRFSLGLDALAVNVDSASYIEYETACLNALTKNGSLFYTGEPVEGGKGQIKACRQIAKEIYARHGNLLGDHGRIVVPYRTHAGRGGWKSKVAERAFNPNEFQPLMKE